MDNDNIVEIRNATRRYSGKTAFVCKALDIAPNDCIALVGDNGSGKSTLLRVLAGVTRLSEGRIEFGSAWKDSGVAYLPQSGGMYGNLTIRENLSIFKRLFGGLASHDLAGELSKNVGLDRYEGVRVRSLSGGFQKLAALMALLSVKAKILILDEPSAELNDLHVDVLAEIISRSRPHYLSIIFAEHEAKIIAVADRQIGLSAP